MIGWVIALVKCNIFSVQEISFALMPVLFLLFLLNYKHNIFYNLFLNLSGK